MNRDPDERRDAPRVRPRYVGRWAAACAAPAVGVFAFVTMTGMTCMTTMPPDDGTPDPGPDLAQILQIVADDHTLGDSDAPVTVVEYASFQCPDCGMFDRDSFETIRTDFIDTGQVRWVLRHFPTRRELECAEASARGSECAADQGMFWEFAEQLFFNQVAASLCNSGLKQNAVTVGIPDLDAFNACIDNAQQKAARVQRDLDSGKAAGVEVIPTFFINGVPVEGLQTTDQFSALLVKAGAVAGGTP
ncbi:MAG: thioredoxin domain-containing protein [Phycisphaerae bacterium]